VLSPASTNHESLEPPSSSKPDTDLLLLGEQHHYHREAVHAALARGVEVR